MMAAADSVSGLRLNALGGVELTCGRFRDVRLPRHQHDGLMLSVFSDGVQRIRCRAEDHVGRPGVLIAVPPGEVHAGEPGDAAGWRYRSITIPSPLIRRLTRTKTPYFHCATAIIDHALCGMLELLFDSFGEAPLLELEESLLVILTRFMVQHARLSPALVGRGRETRAVATCKAYLAARLDRNVRLAELEVVTGLDRFRLVKSFTQMAGLPPHAWHVQRRLDHAQDLLSRGRSICDAACATGFADQAHFTRAFRRLKGLPPGRYRDGHLALARRDACATIQTSRASLP